MWEALVAAIPPTLAVVIVAIVQRHRDKRTREQVHEVKVELNGRLEQLLSDHSAAGELRGRQAERREHPELPEPPE